MFLRFDNLTNYTGLRPHPGNYECTLLHFCGPSLEVRSVRLEEVRVFTQSERRRKSEDRYYKGDGSYDTG